MAQRQMCSRREAERLIDAQQVWVNGELVRQQGCKTSLDAEIVIGEKAKREWLATRATVLLNKPEGFVSTNPDRHQATAWELITPDNYHGTRDEKNEMEEEKWKRCVDEPYYLNVCGRLDKDSHGMLVSVSQIG